MTLRAMVEGFRNALILDDVQERTLAALVAMATAAGATPEQLAEIRKEFAERMQTLRPHILAFAQLERTPDDALH